MKLAILIMIQFLGLMTIFSNGIIKFNDKEIGPSTEYINSPDNKKIAFIMSKYPYKDVVILDKNYGKILALYVYDKESDEITILQSMENDGIHQMPWGGLQWSPNSKYLLVDMGTSPKRTKIIFDLEGSSFSIKVLRNEIFLTENKIYYTDFNEEFSYYNAPTGIDGFLSVASSNYDGSITTLKEGTRNKSYRIIDIEANKLKIKYEYWDVIPPNEGEYMPTFYKDHEEVIYFEISK